MVLLSLDSNEAELLSALRELRLSIIGDEDEKLALLHSPNLETIFHLINQSTTGQCSSPAALQHILIILYSLSILPESLPELIKGRNLFSVLMRVAIKNKKDDAVLINVFNILSNVLSARKDYHMDLVSPEGLQFHNVIYHKLSDHDKNIQGHVWISNNNRVLLSIFKLIPHLNPGEMKTLISPTLKILDVIFQRPLESLLETYGSKKLYTECFDQVFIPLPPSMILFANFTCPLLFSLSHMLYHGSDPLLKPPGGSLMTMAAPENNNNKVKIDDVLNKDQFFVISSLLKAQDPELKLAAINVLVNYSQDSNLTDYQKAINVQKLLPYFIQLMNLDNANNLIVYKSGLNLSRKFNPLNILSTLSLNFEFVNEFLLNCNIITKFVEYVSKLNKIPMETLSLSKMDNLCYIFLILSSLTATKEVNRSAILSDDLTNTIEKTLEFHLIQLKTFMQNSDETIISSTVAGSNDTDQEELLITSNHLAIGASYLLRSFSRSISTLRTHLNERPTINYLLETIAVPEDELLKACQLNQELLHAEFLLKTVTLAIISNVVLDFSPLRKNLLQGGLVDSIGKLLNGTNDVNILLTSLWVLRHIIYNEKIDARERYLRPIGLTKVVEFCNHEDPQIQEMAFNVLRNLTTNSKTHVIQLLNFFNDEDDNDDDTEKRQRWLNFLKMKMDSHSMYDKSNYPILETIVYVIVHISTIDESCRDLIVSNEGLMKTLHELMKNCASSAVKLACIWVIINLTWVENVQRSGERSMHGVQVLGMDIEDTSDVRDYDGDDSGTGNYMNRLRDLRSIRSQNQQPLNSNNIQLPAPQQDQLQPQLQASTSSYNRVRKLNEVGFRSVLSELLDNVDDLDLKERIKVALSNFGTRL